MVLSYQLSGDSSLFGKRRDNISSLSKSKYTDREGRVWLLAAVPDFSETTDDSHGSLVSRMTFDREAMIEFIVFWIGSSAIRAFGGCLGSKRR